MGKDLIMNYENIENQIIQSIKKYNWEFLLKELPLESILVGGYIRDLLLENSNQILDIDIVVPENAIEICKKISKKFNCKFVVLDERRNVGRVIFKEFVIDIACRVGKTIIEDLESRDFTINSIGFHINQRKIIDPQNGLIDLNLLKLNCPNKNNLIEDPLRILRFFRFYSEYNFEFEDSLINFITENKKLLKEVATERIIYELRKIFKSKRSLQSLLLMNEIKLFDWLQTYEHLSTKYISNVNFQRFTIKEVESFLPIYYLTEVFEEGAIKKLKFSKLEISSSKVIKKWKKKLINKTIDQFTELERFQLHSEMEKILPAFIFYLPFEDQNYWLARWRDVNDRLFHPRHLINGNSLKRHLNLHDGPLLGKLLNYLSKEYAFERINNFDEAIYEAGRWIQQNAPKCD